MSNFDEVFTLSQTQGGLWEARDPEHGVVVTFKEHRFADTHRVVIESGANGMGITSAEEAAECVSNLEWWLRHRHYNTVMPSLLDRRKELGQRVRMLRMERGMTQAQLAALAGITSGNVFRIEAGMYSMGIDLVNRIADALGVRLVLV